MDAFLSQIIPWAPTFAPKNWAFCHGQLLEISQYQAMYALLGTTYGGNGTTNFALPDLRGRIPIGSGRDPYLQIYYPFGTPGGYESVPIQANQMPPHNHQLTNNLTGNIRTYPNSDGNTDAPDASGNSVLAKAYGTASVDPDIYSSSTANLTPLGGVSLSGTVTVDNAGSNQGLSTITQYQAVNYIMCIVNGQFPSRN